MRTLKELLEQLCACSPAIEWAGDKTIEEVVKECHRGDWLLWKGYMLGVDERKLFLARGHCANTVRHLMKDERSIKLADTVIAYGEGKATKEDLEIASSAYSYPSASAALAAYSAYCATLAAALAADDRAQNQLQTADICREHIGKLIIDKVNELLKK